MAMQITKQLGDMKWMRGIVHGLGFQSTWDDDTCDGFDGPAAGIGDESDTSTPCRIA